MCPSNLVFYIDEKTGNRQVGACLLDYGHLRRVRNGGWVYRDTEKMRAAHREADPGALRQGIFLLPLTNQSPTPSLGCNPGR